MKKALFKTMMCAAVSGTLFALASCSTEVDDLFDPVKYEQRYTDAYESVIGESIDPYQTWNTAKKATVSVNMPFISGNSTVRVYNKSYLLKDCVLYGSGVVQNGVGNINVDLPTDVKQVFVTIKNSEGLFRICDNYNVSDGMVLVVQGREATTRSADTRVSQGSLRTITDLYYDTEALGYIYHYGNDWAQKSFAEWEAYYEGGCNDANNGNLWIFNSDIGPYEISSVIKSSSEQLGWTYNGQSKSFDDWIAYYKNLYENNTLSESNNYGPYELSSMFDCEIDQIGWTYIDPWNNVKSKTYDEWKSYYEQEIANGNIANGNYGPYELTVTEEQLGWTYNGQTKTYEDWKSYYMDLYNNGKLSTENNGPWEISDIFEAQAGNTKIGYTTADNVSKTYNEWEQWYRNNVGNGTITSEDNNNGPYVLSSIYSAETVRKLTFNYDSRTAEAWQQYYRDNLSNAKSYNAGPWELSSIITQEQIGWSYYGWNNKTYAEWQTYYTTAGFYDLLNSHQGPYDLSSICTIQKDEWGNITGYTDFHFDSPTIRTDATITEYYAEGVDFSNPVLRSEATESVEKVETWTFGNAELKSGVTDYMETGSYTPNFDNLTLASIPTRNGATAYSSKVYSLDYDNLTLRTDATVTVYGNEKYSNPHYDNPQLKTSGVSEWSPGGYATDFSSPVVRTDRVEYYYGSEPVTVYDMTDVPYTESAPWKLGWGRDMFGPDSFFEEGADYRTKANNTKLTGQGYSISSMEKGITITTTGGEIKMSLIYGGTIYAAKFGYIYYKDGQDPLSQPHYVMIDDASTKNSYHFADGTTPNGTNLTNWQAGNQPLNSFGYTTEDVLYGKVFKPVFFGENHNEAGTYSFPRDYKIVFFVDDSEGRGTSRGFSYSVPALNTRLKNGNGWYSHLASADKQAGELTEKKADTRADTRASSTGDGVVTAAVWNYNGVTYLGIEDDSDFATRDTNDLVFELEGAYSLDVPALSVPKTYEGPVTPGEKDDDTEQGDTSDTEQGGSGDTEQGGSEGTGSETLTQEEQNVPSQSWILAFEDLGGQFDFDFNDVVLEVKRVVSSSKTTLEVTPLAAGGSLPAYVMYKGDYITGDESTSEIHAMLGGTATNVLINTEEGDSRKTGTPIEIEVANGFSLGDNMGGFSIKVIGQRGWAVGYEVTAPGQGSSPQMICIDGSKGWAWPTERVCIEDAYPSFGEWGANYESSTDWYTKPASDKVKDMYGNEVSPTWGGN